MLFFFNCSGFCHTLKWISHGFTCVPHPDPPSHLPLHPIPLGLPSAPGPSTCLMHPTWAGDLFSGIICISGVVGISPGNLDSSLWVIPSSDCSTPLFFVAKIPHFVNFFNPFCSVFFCSLLDHWRLAFTLTVPTVAIPSSSLPWTYLHNSTDLNTSRRHFLPSS